MCRWPRCLASEAIAGGPVYSGVMSRTIAVIALLAGAGFAQDADPWVTRLSSRKYEVREAAKQDLVEMGLDCLPIVTAVFRSGDHDACRNTLLRRQFSRGGVGP